MNFLTLKKWNHKKKNNIPKKEIAKFFVAEQEAEQTIEEEAMLRPVHDRSEVEQLIESEKLMQTKKLKNECWKWLDKMLGIQWTYKT